MLKKLLPVSVICFLLAGAVASGASIDFYRREAIVSGGSVEFTDTILFSQAPGSMKIPLLFDTQNLRASTTMENHSCKLKDEEYGSMIDCKLPKNREGRLILRFETAELVKAVDRYYHYGNTLRVPEPAEKVVYTSKLESGYILIRDEEGIPFPAYSPKTGEKGSDGRRIFVYWTQNNVSEGEGITAALTFERIGKREENWTDVFIFATGLVFILAVLLLIRRVKSLGNGGEGRMGALKDDEKEIMEIVERAGGEVKQKRIVRKTEFSKAKVSRLIKDLEERGMLEKKKVGRTNRIHKKETEGGSV